MEEDVKDIGAEEYRRAGDSALGYSRGYKQAVTDMHTTLFAFSACLAVAAILLRMTGEK